MINPQIFFRSQLPRYAACIGVIVPLAKANGVTITRFFMATLRFDFSAGNPSKLWQGNKNQPVVQFPVSSFILYHSLDAAPDQAREHHPVGYCFCSQVRLLCVLDFTEHAGVPRCIFILQVSSKTRA